MKEVISGIRCPLLVALPFLIIPACGQLESSPALDVELTRAGLDAIDQDSLLQNTRTLASDEFEGRGTGTRGEDRTVAFLTEQFQSLGLSPGNPDGSWTQEVRLVALRADSEASFVAGDQRMPLETSRDYVAMTRRVTPEVEVVNSELVFVGYGVVAPELGWDDYKGVEVAGKTVVILINDPDNGLAEPGFFRGPAMTYYGRWTHKFEAATAKGAAAAIVIHETEPAGYPWDVVTASFGGENFDIRAADDNMRRVPVEAWLHYETAERLFRAAGFDLDSLKHAARSADFHPVDLDAQVTFRIRNEIRDVVSRNVAAMLRGADPERQDEYVIYTSHWDHFGIGEPDSTGDSIYSGALDNAIGTAGLIELARAFTELDQPPDRSVIFLALTAEERGLLGAKYYATNPLYPLQHTLAIINIDGLNPWGRTADVVLVGQGNTTLDHLIAEEAARQGRHVVPDPEPEKGFFYRSDHFEFAKQGVPALYTHPGVEYRGRPEGWGIQKRREYTLNEYHTPADEAKEDWNLSGAVEDLQLLFLVGYRVASEDKWPEWREGTEFRARRLEMLGLQ